MKIGILTSGGDAPGMNPAIRAITYTAINNGHDVFAIFDGYKGLVNGDIKKIDKNYVNNIINLGGTIIRTARLPEFKELETQKQGIEQLKKHGIDALIVIGGDGSYMGAKKLDALGIKCIGLPGTIDNDISSTDFTIGFDTALNTIVEAIERIKDTSRSHQRCMVVEVMGNNCDDLALYSSIATGADILISKNHNIQEKEIYKILNKKKKEGQLSTLVIVSEKFIDSNKLVENIIKNTTWDTRLTVLGHIQRGGNPTAMEKVLAAKIGYYAVKLLMENKTGVCVGIKNNELVYQDIYEALKKESSSNNELYKILKNLN